MLKNNDSLLLAGLGDGARLTVQTLVDLVSS